MGDDDRVAVCEVLEDRRSDDVRQRDDAQSTGFLGMRPPAHVIAARLFLSQPGAKRLQVRWPFATVVVGDDEMTQGTVQLAAQSGEEGGVTPARLQRRTLGDGLTTDG